MLPVIMKHSVFGRHAALWLHTAQSGPRSNRVGVWVQSVQCFGRKKTAVAVTYCKRGRGLIKINGGLHYSTL